MVTKRLLSNRQHLATLWLLANCAVIVLWPASSMYWFPLGCVAMLAWPVVALVLLVATLAWPVVLRRRIVAVATVLAGAAVGWESRHLGPIFHVWWREDFYLEHARSALAHPSPRGDCGPGWVEVDHSDSPPVRAAFFCFAAHGDVDGFVYDPTAQVATGRQEWLYGARARHLFGPWYRFAN